MAGVVGVFEEEGECILLPKLVESFDCAFAAETASVADRRIRRTARLPTTAGFIGSPVALQSVPILSCGLSGAYSVLHFFADS